MIIQNGCAKEPDFGVKKIQTHFNIDAAPCFDVTYSPESESVISKLAFLEPPEILVVLRHIFIFFVWCVRIVCIRVFGARYLFKIKILFFLLSILLLKRWSWKQKIVLLFHFVILKFLICWSLNDMRISTKWAITWRLLSRRCWFCTFKASHEFGMLLRLQLLLTFRNF